MEGIVSQYPVPPEALRSDGLFSYLRRHGQNLVKLPNRAPDILKTVEQDLRDYYAKVSDANPAFGEFKITRALHKLAVSVALHKGTSEAVDVLVGDFKGDIVPVVEGIVELDKYFPVLSELNIFGVQTEQARGFIKRVGGVMLDIADVGVVNPSDYWRILAEQTTEMRHRFAEAEAAYKGSTHQPYDNDEWALSIAEDNGHAILHAILGMSVHTLNESGGALPQADMLADVLVEQRTIAGLASVHRNFAERNIRPLEPAPNFRARIVAAYENALLGNTPLDGSLSYFTIDQRGEVRVPHRSLRDGTWREPGYCAGFPRYRPANHDYDNAWKFRGIVAERALIEEHSLLPWIDTYSAVDIGISFGALEAERSLYPTFPRVVTTIGRPTGD